MALAAPKLDTIHRVTTPEGVELTLSLAGPLSRARAYAIDFVIRAGIIFVLSVPLGSMGKLGYGLFLILWFFVDWFYPVVCEVFYRGSSPGKRSCKIRAVCDDGTPIGWRESLLRNLLRAVDALPLMYMFGYISMMLNGQFKRIGDLVAGTIVIYEPTPTQARVVAQVEPSAPSVALKLHEQQVIIDFSQRAAQITPERAEEIAALVGNVIGNISQQTTPSRTGYPHAERLIAVANHLLGAQPKIAKPLTTVAADDKIL
jgi:uncharacterized RDD family membrane protein YckC